MAKTVPDPLDRAENERQLFTGFMAVREHYEIAPAGIVIGSGNRVRWHAPIAHPELPQMIAKLATATDAAVIAFYRVYGSLGFTELSRDPKDHIYTWPDGRQTMGGDPLEWVRAHARRVQTCFELTDALQRTDKAALARLTKTVPVRGAETLVTRARLMRAAIINPNIAGIHRVLTVQADGTEQSRFHFSGQIEVVYWHLANVVDGGIVGRCKRPGCGAFFIQRHRSQEYCAPRYAQRESPCALWVRQRRLGQPKTMIMKTKTRKTT